MFHAEKEGAEGRILCADRCTDYMLFLKKYVINRHVKGWHMVGEVTYTICCFSGYVFSKKQNKLLICQHEMLLNRVGYSLLTR